MTGEFIHQELRVLTDQQVRFAPPGQRRQQLERAAELRAEIDPGRDYPYSFVCFRVTGFRGDGGMGPLIRGSELADDLGRLMRALERSLPAVPAGPGAEPSLTLREVCERFNVSAKTISRWRGQGLVGQRVVRGGRRQLEFPQSAVARFTQAHPDKVARGSRFSHLSEAERAEALRRVGRLARAGAGLTEACRRAARRLGRSAESVRKAVKEHDRKHPGRALFPDMTGPLTAASKHTIYDLYRRGVAVNAIAKEYGRTPNTVYRVVNEARAEEVLARPVDYIHHESFDDPAMESDILGPMPDAERFEKERRARKIPKDVPAEFLSLYEMPLLSREQEQHLFRKMNYLKYKLAVLRDRIDPAKARKHELDRCEGLEEQIREVKDTLIQCNMRLVVSIAKKHANHAESLFDLVSDGNVSLIRAVEKFDFSRGNKFSTYASWAIMKNFARSIPVEKTHRDRYVTGNEELFDAKADARTDEQEVLSQAEQAKQRINNLLSGLDARTREVIRMRAGLDGDERTLEQIGQHFGITKERVRQINVRGMKILRERAAAEKIDLP